MQGAKTKEKRKLYYFGKHKVSQRCHPQSNPKLRKLVPFRPFTKYCQLDVIHLTRDKLEESLSPICIMTRGKKAKFQIEIVLVQKTVKAI